ncbi:MAG: tellurite resistance methyltransferase TehB [Advenella sp.]
MSDQADYFHEKYGMTKTHSAVVEAMQTVAPCKALDLGCGQGRNALYLSLKGFDVTASDYNPGGMGTVDSIAQAEGLKVRTLVYDMNQAQIDERYDFMVATVVFMFLQGNRVPDIIANMQAQTNPGGYHLIVSAMDTADHPCHMPFSFTFKENELREYYKDWELITYQEEVGSMHARDAQGNPVQLKFVTMLAKKMA